MFGSDKDKDYTKLLVVTPELKYWNTCIRLRLLQDSPIPTNSPIFIRGKFVPRVQRQSDGSYYVWGSRWDWKRFLEVAFRLPDEQERAEILEGLKSKGIGT